MEIYVRVKVPGKRREVLAPIARELPEGIGSLRQLLRIIVEQEVARYNAAPEDTQLIPFLTQEALDDQIRAGRVSFGRIYSDKKADPEKAVLNALQCWEDGIVRVFLNDEELTQLDAPLVIPEKAQLTFLRLTFLAGSLW